jgi:hypothetical protein
MRARTFLVLAVTASAATTSALARAEREPLPWAHTSGYSVFATAFLGDGLRFNNPYRLATPLGSTAESVSRSATYTELGVGAALGDPLGFEHGATLRAAFAVEGIPQAVLTPSYLLWRRWRVWAAYGRLGVPIVATPESTWGVEAAGGGVWFIRGGLGLAAELVGDVFYGAGTRDAATPAYPMLSGQLGLFFAYEVLP